MNRNNDFIVKIKQSIINKLSKALKKYLKIKKYREQIKRWDYLAYKWLWNLPMIWSYKLEVKIEIPSRLRSINPRCVVRWSVFLFCYKKTYRVDTWDRDIIGKNACANNFLFPSILREEFSSLRWQCSFFFFFCGPRGGVGSIKKQRKVHSYHMEIPNKPLKTVNL